MNLEKPVNGKAIFSENSSKTAFSLEVRPCGGAMVFHCQGRLIFRKEAHALANAVMQVLPFARRMVVDLAGVESIDSAGLGELVLLHMWAEAAGYELRFSGATRSVRQVLQLTNLDSVLDLHSTVPEAISAMASEPAEAS